jgi:hypothetical protein
VAVDLAEGSIFSIAGAGLVMPFTVCGWVRPDVAADTGAPPYRSVWYLGNASYGNYIALFLNDDPALVADDAAAPSEKLIGPTVTIGDWYFFAIVAEAGASQFELFWRSEGETSLATTSATWSGTLAVNTLRWGGAPGEATASCFDGAVAYGRMFTSALTQAQLLDESASATAIQTEWADWPFTDTATSTTDASGNGRTLTLTGSQSNTTGPDISLDAPVGAIGETDALAPAPRTSSKTVGLTSEADALSAASHAHAISSGVVAESDSLAAAGHAASHDVAVLTETDTLAAATRTSTHTVGALAESDALAAVLHSTATELGVLGEADALAVANRSTSHAAALITETDALLAAGTVEEVGALAEADAFSVAEHSSARGAGLLAETDTLFPVGRTSTRATGVLAEVDALAAAQRGALISVGALAELDVLASVVEEVAGTPRFTTRARPLVSVGTTAKATIHMEVRP